MKKLFAVVVLVVSSGMAMAQTKVAHVNSQALLDTMPSRKAAVIDIQEFEKAGYEELQAMQMDFQNEYDLYLRDKPNLTPVKIQIREENLANKEQRIMERQQSLQNQMGKLVEELNGPILDRMQTAIKTVAERKKITYVLDESNLLYSGGEDITNEVIVELLKLDAAANK